jgi:hypothetical protein
MTKKPKKKSWFYRGYFGFVKHRLSELRDYVLEMEAKFSRDLKAIEKRYDEDIRRRGSEAELPSELVEYYADDFYVVERIFLRTFRYSAIVAIYSLLETSMNSLCSLLQKRNELKIELSDLRGDGIERAKSYLIKVCAIQFEDGCHEWTEIQKLNYIRNCIVHAEGNVDHTHSPSKLRRLVKNTKGVTLENDRYLSIDKAYLESAITWVDDFLQDIHEKALLKLNDTA